MAAKIAIFDWGGETIHAYYLAGQLSKNGIQVDLFLFIPFRKRSKFNIKSFLPDPVPDNIRIIIINGTAFEEKLMKLNRFTQIMFHPFPLIYIHLLLPYRTRKLFNASHYKYIITISVYSLYWLYKTDSSCIQKLIHYSLEIEKVSDPLVKRHWKLVPLLKKELLLLGSAKGLIIQDQLRLNALLEGASCPTLQIFYLPVSIPGRIITSRSDYFHKKFHLRPDQKIVLYYGAVFNERKLDELVEAFTKITDPDLVLVLHAGNGTFSYGSLPVNIKISNNPIPYHQLHDMVSAATIGIALYDTGWPNTRFTAFSSEKIARYLQAGVPFVAFANESYFNLKNEFDCCELIDEVTEIEKAIRKLLDNYEYYRRNCFKAYEKYYNIEHTARPLCEFLLT